ncbi:MAG: hypothetical protein E6040_10850 [Lachnospiraceae bacterium]|nr:hypothetical protein [Lachnospiraceae bacterium]
MGKREEFLKQLFNEDDIYKVREIFDKNCEDFEECILIHFGTSYSGSYNEFRGFSVNNYSAFGVANYEHAFLLDKNTNDGVMVVRVINLDLNIIQYLSQIIKNKKINNENEFIRYLNKIKEYKMTPNMSIAVIERMSKLGGNESEKIFSEQVLSYVKFLTLPIITKEKLQEDILLPEDKYKMAYKIMEKVNMLKGETIYHEIIAIQALIMKAFLLKMDKKMSKKGKIQELINFCLLDLNVYMENELYLCALYLNDAPEVKRIFEKIETYSKETVRRIKNISWDLANIRLSEKQIIDDLKSGKVIFHYLGTYDKGLQDAIKINPIVIMGKVSGSQIIIRKNRIENMDIFDESMLEYYSKIIGERPKEKNTLEQINDICESVEKDISKRQNDYFS